MAETPLVSVIVPVCDGEPYIGATLDAALSQTYSHLELIVVDDGSRDGTGRTIEARAARDSRVRVISQANRGVAAARNQALAAARGELVAPLDADDLWEPTKLERQVRRMAEAGEQTGLVYCWWMWIDGGGALLDRSPRWRIEGDGAERLLQMNYTGNASVPLYRRRYLEEVGGYDPTLRERGAEGCEDLDIALKVAERSEVAVVPAVLVGYRRRGDSMSACTERMRRSHALVVAEARRRRPAVAARSIQRAHDQFALYLAGVSFWSGAYAQAAGWGLRSLRSSVTFRVLPHVARLVAKTLRRRAPEPSRNVVEPGLRFAEWQFPEALIPYDRIYERYFARRAGK
jgi:GT2 family glycosyltransferase